MAKNNVELVAHARKAVTEDWQYVYGTYGQVITQAILDRVFARWSIYQRAGYKEITALRGLGHRGADCIGLFKSYLWWVDDNHNPAYPVGDNVSDRSANKMFEYAQQNGLKWGTIGSIPEVPGIGVYSNGHFGIYLTGGQVIEAIGATDNEVDGQYYHGVVQTPLHGARNAPWTHWYFLPFIEYILLKPTDTVKKYDKGDSVKWVQTKLSELSYNIGTWGIDGSFGSATEAAVKAFQKDYGLAITGIADLATLDMLETPVKPSWVNPYVRPANTAIIKYGMKGLGVLWVQTVLKHWSGSETFKVDGAFGSATLAMVKLFQSKNGLKADGIVGAKTLTALDNFNI